MNFLINKTPNIYSKSGELIRGTLKNDCFVQQGIFKYNALVEGLQHSNGVVSEGTFDWDSGKLVQGTKNFPDGMVCEGTFNRFSGNILKGETKLPSGERQIGDWDKNGEGKFVSGQIYKQDGTVLSGKFSSKTGFLTSGSSNGSRESSNGQYDMFKGKLIEGQVLSQKGDKYQGIFSTLNSRLLKGTKLYINNSSMSGVFHSKTSKLLKGQYTIDEQQMLDGIFDQETGQLLFGKKIIDGLEYYGQFDRVTGEKLVLQQGSQDQETGFFNQNNQLIYGTKTKADGIYSGLFQQQSGNDLIYGRIQFSNGEIENGLFDTNTKRLIWGTRHSKQYVGDSSSSYNQQIEDGFFDCTTGYLIFGNFINAIGDILNGWFYNAQFQKLYTGSKNLKSGKQSEGYFNNDVENSAIVAKVVFENGDVENGHWSPSGFLSSGEKNRPDGRTQQGLFSEQDGQLLQGTIEYSDGDMFTGIFKNGILTQGVKDLISGKRLIGTFNETGEIVEGEIKFDKDTIEFGCWGSDGFLTKGCKFKGSFIEYGIFDEKTGLLLQGYSGEESDEALAARWEKWYV